MHERKFHCHKTGVVSNVSFLQGTADGRRWTVRERGQKENHNELTNIMGGPAFLSKSKDLERNHHACAWAYGTVYYDYGERSIIWNGELRLCMHGECLECNGCMNRKRMRDDGVESCEDSMKAD